MGGREENPDPALQSIVRGIYPICGGRNGVLFAAPSSVFSFAHILVFLKCWKDNMGRKQIAAKELRIDENL